MSLNRPWPGRSPREPSRSETFGIYLVFVALLGLSALDAYDAGRVPVQWLMQVGSMLLGLFIFVRHGLPTAVGHRVFWVFVAWCALTTAVGSVRGHYSVLVPPNATTPYLLFVSLRIVTLFFYASCLYTSIWLAREGFKAGILQALVVIGLIVAVAALYIYIAQVYGLPEPPRTRLGTSGGAQAVKFTYDFHRATGTFREPSLLAAWLIVPLMLSFSVASRMRYLAAVLMGGVFLLTGSLSGIVAVLVGILVAAAAAVGFRAVKPRALFPVLLPTLAVVAIALAVFYGLAVSNTGHGVNLFATLGDRLLVIIKGGLGQSDRNLVYGYLNHARPSVFGVGLGNANLLLTQYLHTSVIASFISLFLDTLYGAGLVGLALLLTYLIYPVLTVVPNRELRTRPVLLQFFGPYVAWLVVFVVAMEELTFMFAVLSGLLSYEISAAVAARRAEKSPSTIGFSQPARTAAAEGNLRTGQPT